MIQATWNSCKLLPFHRRLKTQVQEGKNSSLKYFISCTCKVFDYAKAFATTVSQPEKTTNLLTLTRKFLQPQGKNTTGQNGVLHVMFALVFQQNNEQFNFLANMNFIHFWLTFTDGPL